MNPPILSKKIDDSVKRYTLEQLKELKESELSKVIPSGMKGMPGIMRNTTVGKYHSPCCAPPKVHMRKSFYDMDTMFSNGRYENDYDNIASKQQQNNNGYSTKSSIDRAAPKPKEPEWFTNGPESKYDRIDLFGFDNIESNNLSSDFAKTSGNAMDSSQNSSTSNILLQSGMTGETDDTMNTIITANSRNTSPPPARSTPAKRGGHKSNENPHKDGDFLNFDEFLKLRSIHSLTQAPQIPTASIDCLDDSLKWPMTPFPKIINNIDNLESQLLASSIRDITNQQSLTDDTIKIMSSPMQQSSNPTTPTNAIKKDFEEFLMKIDVNNAAKLKQPPNSAISQTEQKKLNDLKLIFPSFMLSMQSNIVESGPSAPPPSELVKKINGEFANSSNKANKSESKQLHLETPEAKAILGRLKTGEITPSYVQEVLTNSSLHIKERHMLEAVLEHYNDLNVEPFPECPGMPLDLQYNIQSILQDSPPKGDKVKENFFKQFRGKQQLVDHNPKQSLANKLQQFPKPQGNDYVITAGGPWLYSPPSYVVTVPPPNFCVPPPNYFYSAYAPMAMQPFSQHNQNQMNLIFLKQQRRSALETADHLQKLIDYTKRNQEQITTINSQFYPCKSLMPFKQCQNHANNNVTGAKKNKKNCSKSSSVSPSQSDQCKAFNDQLKSWFPRK